MTESSIQHPGDTPVSRVDILKMKAVELSEYITKIQANRTSVFQKVNEIKERTNKARKNEVYEMIMRIFKRIEKKLSDSEKKLSDSIDLLTRVRALELELDYDAEVEVEENETSVESE